MPSSLQRARSSRPSASHRCTGNGTLAPRRWLPWRWLGLLLAAAFVLLAADASAEMKSVKVREANFRSGPSKDDKVVYLALRYYPVKVLKRKDRWLYVRDFQGEKAWVAGWLLSDQEAVIVKTRRANIRKESTSRSDKVCRAKRGWAYRVLARKGKWARVADEHGAVGWIHSKLLWGLEKKKK